MRRPIFSGILWITLAMGLNVSAQESSLNFEYLWDLPELYKGEGGFLQRLAFTGMMQYQVGLVDSSQGDYDEASFRRVRLGARAEIMDHFLLSAKANLKPEEHNFVKGISTAYIAWSPYGSDKKSLEKFKLIVGKVKPKFSREYSTNSKKIKTLERSLFVNQLAPAKATGLWMGGSAGRAIYALGLLSGGSSDIISGFDQGTFFIAKAGLDVGENLNVGLDYLAAGSSEDIGSGFDHAVSFSALINDKYQSGNWELMTDLLYGLDSESGFDSYAWVLLPSYRLSDSFEVVFRYQLAGSNADGLRLQKNYERQVGRLDHGQWGSAYQAAYLGLNYYIYGHKLKLMTGLEYSKMEAEQGAEVFNGWTWFSGLRLYF